MHKKLLSIIFSCSLLLGLMVAGAPTASATHETIESVSSLMPNDGFVDKDQLADQNDGQDSTAHLTALADPAADRMLWYVCEGGAVPETVGGDCASIGTDTTGVQPDVDDDGDPDTLEQPAEAYEFNWDIPSAFDSDITGDEYEIWAVACIGAPDDVDPDINDASNCLSVTEASIFLDDGATSSRVGAFANHTEVSTGEIALFCSGGDGGGDVEECDELDEGSTFDHGSALPNNDMAVAFTTSDDVDLAQACIDDLDTADELEERDASAVEPEGCDAYPTATILLDEDNPIDPDPGRAWVSFFPDGSAPDGGDFEVAAYGNGRDQTGTECDYAGAGFAGAPTGPILDEDGGVLAASGPVEASGICVFDEHYAANDEIVQTGMTGSFVDDVDAVAEDPGCGPEDDAVTEWWNFVNADGDADSDTFTVCPVDQFGEPLESEQITWELTGPGSFEDGSPWDCDADDLDGDDNGTNEVCIGSGSASWDTGEYANIIGPEIDADTGDVVPGTVTITACLDETADPNDADFGCDDATVSTTLIKHFIGGPVDIEVVFQVEGATNVESCATGPTFKLNLTGDRDTLVACTYDFYGNLVSTDIDEMLTETEISFFTGGSEVGPTSAPPTETGPDGTATIEIAALEAGSGDPGFDIANADGGCCTDSDFVTKTIEQGPPPGPQCNDGADNDGDGLIDYPADPGCQSLDDNTEADGGGEVRPHNRNAKLTSLGHKGGKLRVKGRVNVPDGFDACASFAPVRVQKKSGGSWRNKRRTFTNGNGRFSVRIKDRTGRYRVVATRFTINQGDGSTDVCRKDNSPAKRHRH